MGLALVAYVIINMHSSELSPAAQAILVVAAVSIVALFLFVETKARMPMLPIKLFSSSKFAVACAVGLILNFSFFGQLFALSLFFQNYLGFEAWKAGLALAPQACSAIVAAPLGGRYSARIGEVRVIVMGLVAGAIGFAGLAFFQPSTPYILIALSTFLGGFGMAFAMPAATSMAVHAAPADYAGSASGVVNCLRQIGSLLGVALLGSLVAGDEFLHGFHSVGLGASTAFAAAIGLCAVVALLKH